MTDELWMRAALEEAQNCIRPAPQPSDVPVGAVCVFENQIVGRGHNRRELSNDPTAHAEVLALQNASRQLGRWRLDDVTLYVSLEPCPMCAGALWLARVARVVYGARDVKAGACGSLFDVLRDPRLNYQPKVRGGVLEGECAAMLKEFFAGKRLVSR